MRKSLAMEAGHRPSAQVLETWVNDSDCGMEQGGSASPRRGPLFEALLSSKLQHPQARGCALLCPWTPLDILRQCS